MWLGWWVTCGLVVVARKWVIGAAICASNPPTRQVLGGLASLSRPGLPCRRSRADRVDRWRVPRWLIGNTLPAVSVRSQSSKIWQSCTASSRSRAQGFPALRHGAPRTPQTQPCTPSGGWRAAGEGFGPLGHNRVNGWCNTEAHLLCRSFLELNPRRALLYVPVRLDGPCNGSVHAVAPQGSVTPPWQRCSARRGTTRRRS